MLLLRNYKLLWNLLFLWNKCKYSWVPLKTPWQMTLNSFSKSNILKLSKKSMPKFKHNLSNNHRRKKRNRKPQNLSNYLKLWIRLYHSLHRWNHPHRNSLLVQNLSQQLKMSNGFCLTYHPLWKNLLFSSIPANMDLRKQIGETAVLANNIPLPSLNHQQTDYLVVMYTWNGRNAVIIEVTPRALYFQWISKRLSNLQKQIVLFISIGVVHLDLVVTL